MSRMNIGHLNIGPKEATSQKKMNLRNVNQFSLSTNNYCSITVTMSDHCIFLMLWRVYFSAIRIELKKTFLLIFDQLKKKTKSIEG